MAVTIYRAGNLVKERSLWSRSTLNELCYSGGQLSGSKRKCALSFKETKGRGRVSSHISEHIQ